MNILLWIGLTIIVTQTAHYCLDKWDANKAEGQTDE